MYRPMLAKKGSKSLLDSQDHLFEPKLDGTRALCYRDDDIRLVNRRGRRIEQRYPEFHFLDRLHCDDCVLDGEVIVYDGEGNPSFSLLQRREHASLGKVEVRARRYPATYVVFDILERDGEELLSMPLEERKEELKKVVEEGGGIQMMFHTMKGRELWDIVEERGLEGVIAKKKGSRYEEGRRSWSWVKIKTTATIDCVILGYTSEKRPVSSLVLGLYDEGSLTHVGRVGTGFTVGFIGRLGELLEDIRTEEPLIHPPPRRDIRWVRPKLVCEVEYLELTKGGHLRAPVFLRLRDDKPPEECTMDQLGE